MPLAQKMKRLGIAVACAVATSWLCPGGNADSPPMPEVPTLSAAAIAAAQADPELQQAYHRVIDAPADWQEGLQNLMFLAPKGNVVTQATTCVLLLEQPTGMYGDVAGTFCWRATKRGYPPAALLIGIHCLYSGDPMLVQRGYQWLEMARKQGIADAAVVLASAYQRGIGVAKDTGKAQALIAPLLREDTAIGLYALSVQYRRGIGVPVNLAKADDYLRQAAAEGDVRAQLDYAGMLWEQENKLPSLKTAWRDWLERAIASELTWMMTWRPGQQTNVE